MGLCALGAQLLLPANPCQGVHSLLLNALAQHHEQKIGAGFVQNLTGAFTLIVRSAASTLGICVY